MLFIRLQPSWRPDWPTANSKNSAVHSRRVGAFSYQYQNPSAQRRCGWPRESRIKPMTEVSIQEATFRLHFDSSAVAFQGRQRAAPTL